MTNLTPLSPAAQAVLDAAYALPLKNGQPNIAAALRAAADQTRKQRLCPTMGWAVKDQDFCLVSDLEAIAAELEGVDG